MKSTFKKIAATMLVVPMLVLGIGVLGATPAYAAVPSCETGNGGAGTYKPPSGSKYCKTSGGNYFDENGNSVDKARAESECDETKGIGGAVNENCAKGEGQQTELFGSNGVVTLIINVMLFIIGILCVVMIIFGGIRYTTSTGDKGRVDGAKNTIIYAVVGLVVAIIAYALVNWVFGAVGSQ
jgi:hypothetical protein